MYRALYGFRSAEPNSLAFAVGETFLLLERSNQHWWLVTRAGSGETGYVPASYLQRLQVRQGAKDGRGQQRGRWSPAWPRTDLEVSAAFLEVATRAPLRSAGLSARRSEAKARCPAGTGLKISQAGGFFCF